LLVEIIFRGARCTCARLGEAQIKATVAARFGVDTFGIGEDAGQPVTHGHTAVQIQQQDRQRDSHSWPGDAERGWPRPAVIVLPLRLFTGQAS
jgi:hypothetical protein